MQQTSSRADPRVLQTVEPSPTNAALRHFSGRKMRARARGIQTCISSHFDGDRFHGQQEGTAENSSPPHRAIISTQPAPLRAYWRTSHGTPLSPTTPSLLAGARHRQATMLVPVKPRSDTCFPTK